MSKWRKVWEAWVEVLDAALWPIKWPMWAIARWRARR